MALHTVLTVVAQQQSPHMKVATCLDGKEDYPLPKKLAYSMRRDIQDRHGTAMS